VGMISCGRRRGQLGLRAAVLPPWDAVAPPTHLAEIDNEPSHCPQNPDTRVEVERFLLGYVLLWEDAALLFRPTKAHQTWPEPRR
jgi:hypothetical protein